MDASRRGYTSLMATAPSTSLRDEPMGEWMAVTLAGHGVMKMQPMSSLRQAGSAHGLFFGQARGQLDGRDQRQHMVDAAVESARG